MPDPNKISKNRLEIPSFLFGNLHSPGLFSSAGKNFLNNKNYHKVTDYQNDWAKLEIDNVLVRSF